MGITRIITWLVEVISMSLPDCVVPAGGPQHELHPRDPSTQIIFTLGPIVCRIYLHWAIWIPKP